MPRLNLKKLRTFTTSSKMKRLFSSPFDTEGTHNFWPPFRDGIPVEESNEEAGSAEQNLMTTGMPANT